MNAIRTIILISIATLAAIKSSYSQTHLFYVSIQGSWDKHKQKERAQFGGDNKLINSYFGSFQKDLIRSGYDAAGTGSISFLVTPKGIVDSLTIQNLQGKCGTVPFTRSFNP